LDESARLLIFPYSEHKNEILMFILKYFITTRMRQYWNVENNKQKKIKFEEKEGCRINYNLIIAFNLLLFLIIGTFKLYLYKVYIMYFFKKN